VAHESETRDAVAAVVDPVLRRPIGALGMVVEVTNSGALPRVLIADPLERPREALVTAVTDALDGDVEVEVRAMTDDEANATAAILKGEHPDPLKPVDAAAAAHGHDHEHGRTNPFTDARTRVLAVASGKGGVGKSSVTTNLAIALAERGHRVAAVDADVWGFSMPRMLGIDHPPSLIGELIVPPEAHGVRLISMGFFAREDQPVVWRGPMLHKALEQFLTDVYWDEPDYLVVDMPPGTGDVSLSMAQFLPGAEFVIVTTPQPAAQRVAQRAAFMAQKVNLEVLGVIENMSWFHGDDGTTYELFGSGGGAALATLLDAPLLGQVPLVPALREGGDVGSPIVVVDPDDEASQVFRSIAERVDELAPRKIRHPELKVT